MEDRLKKLYASLGLNVGAKSSNLAMIKSICAGFSIVEQNFDTVLNEIFADSSLNIGRQKMCELFDVTRFDKDVIKKFISSKYDDYRLNELKNEFQKILDSFEIGFSSSTTMMFTIIVLLIVLLIFLIVFPYCFCMLPKTFFILRILCIILASYFYHFLQTDFNKKSKNKSSLSVFALFLYYFIFNSLSYTY